MDTLTVPVQVVFVSPGASGVVIDCVVCDRVRAASITIEPGAPFTLVVGATPGDRQLEPAIRVLERWSRLDRVVELVGSATDAALVLRSAGEELVLDLG